MVSMGGRVLPRHPGVHHGILVVGICALLVLMVPPGALLERTASPGGAPSGPIGFDLSLPTISSHKDFNVSGPSGSSPAFSSHTGDTILVFLSAFGTNSLGVSDSVHDHFSLLVSATQSSPNGASSFGIFAAFNVSAGSPKTVTATLTGSSTDSAAGAVVDVTGVGPHPLDSVGTLANYSTAKDPLNSSAEIPATASDLVVGAVSAHQTRVWSAARGDTLLNDEHSPVPGAMMSVIDLDRAAPTTGDVWINATTARTGTFWMAEGLSLLPKGSPGHPGTFTFTETGLPSGHSWYVIVGGFPNSSTNSSIGITLPNGTYLFTVGPISGFVATPLSGSIVVGGLSSSQAISFGATTDDWPTYMGEVTRNGDNFNETTLSTANAANLSELWTVPTGYMQTEPIIQHNTVYVGSTNGDEYAINATTGALLWKTFIGQVIQSACDPKPQGITSSATVYGGMIYVGGGNNSGTVNNETNGTANWYALNASTGKIAWNVPIGLISSGYYNWASPLVVNGYAYVGTASRCDKPLVWGGLLQVSLSTHKVVGFFNATVGGGKTRGSSIWGSPTYDATNNTIYVATGNPLKTHVTNFSESVVAINATTLAPISTWQVPPGQTIKDSDFGTTPDYYHLPGGRALVTAMNKNGIVYTLNATNLSLGPYWENQVSYSAYPENVAPVAWGDGLLYDGSGPSNVSGKNYSGAIRAIYPANGTVKWIHGMPGDVYGAPAYANGLVVASGGRNLDVFNALTGAVVWNWTCPATFNSGPSIAEGRIYATCSATFAFGLSGVVAGPANLVSAESSFGIGPAAHPTALTPFLPSTFPPALSTVIAAVRPTGGETRERVFPRRSA